MISTTSRVPRLRAASVCDALAIARVHVACWRETYEDLLPAEILSAQSVASRTTLWDRILREPQSFAAARAYVAEADGEIVGFGSCCEQRAASLLARGFAGEFSAIYVLRSFQRCGIGSAIMGALASDLSSRGLSGASLWVLRENLTARRFYERLNGAVICEKEDSRDGAMLVEVGYGWLDLRSLGR